MTDKMDSCRSLSHSPATLIRSFFRNRQLIWQMTKREIVSRYRGSMLGMAWTVVNPLIMLAVYSFVFSVVFKVRWSAESSSKAEFALALFVGMICHGLLAECITRSPSIITGNQSYVKKVVFPLEILPWVTLGSALFHFLVSLFVWTGFFWLIHHSLKSTLLWVPAILLPLVLFSLGISWFLASVGVYLRDVGQITGVLTTVLLFMSPIFYPASRLPEPYRFFLFLNPLTFIIEQMREVLMWGGGPDLGGLAVAYILSILTTWLGFTWFQKTRGGFADVL